MAGQWNLYSLYAFYEAFMLEWVTHLNFGAAVADVTVIGQHLPLCFSIQFNSVYLYSPISQITNLSQSALQSVISLII